MFSPRAHVNKEADKTKNLPWTSRAMHHRTGTSRLFVLQPVLKDERNYLDSQRKGSGRIAAKLQCFRSVVVNTILDLVERKQERAGHLVPKFLMPMV